MPDTQQALTEWQASHTAWMDQWGQRDQDVLAGLEAGLQLLEDSNTLMQLPDIALADSLQLYRDANALTHRLQQALDLARQELETLQAAEEPASDRAQD